MENIRIVSFRASKFVKGVFSDFSRPKSTQKATVYLPT
jgi:hypothetical protein